MKADVANRMDALDDAQRHQAKRNGGRAEL
jgi:hypothetical protein